MFLCFRDVPETWVSDSCEFCDGLSLAQQTKIVPALEKLRLAQLMRCRGARLLPWSNFTHACGVQERVDRWVSKRCERGDSRDTTHPIKQPRLKGSPPHLKTIGLGCSLGQLTGLAETNTDSSLNRDWRSRRTTLMKKLRYE